MPPLRVAILTCLLLGSAAATADDAVTPQPAASPLHERLDPRARERMLARNLDESVSLPVSLLEERMRDWAARPVGERIALWADLFRQRGDATYCFGLREGGYVAEGLLVQDFKSDCVLFFYRCTDLARSSTAEEAILRALDTRFAGAEQPPVDASGRIDYDDPAHLDFSLDIVRSGTWGRDVTSEVGVAVRDTEGTRRYPAGSFEYIPSARLRMDRLRDGDHLFFVLDENSERGRKLRNEYGLVVGHQGIVRRDGDHVLLLHAASKDLPGVYTGNRVVQVELRTYLERVESHKGVLVTRVEDESNGR